MKTEDVMKYGYGLISGLAATIVLSIFMLIKGATGAIPHVNAIQMLTKLGAMYLALPLYPWIGWAMHFFVGVALWGLVFAATVNLLPGTAYWAKGLSFSVAAWLLMMVILLPLAGAGFFGALLGIGAPVATFVLHLIYGAVLGSTFGALAGRREAAAAKGRPAS